MKKLSMLGIIALTLYAAYGWVMGCCPGVPSCGGCHAMNWERLILIGFFLIVMVFAGVLWLVMKILNHPFGPPLGDDDECSTTNPERDYEDK